MKPFINSLIYIYELLCTDTSTYNSADTIVQDSRNRNKIYLIKQITITFMLIIPTNNTKIQIILKAVVYLNKLNIQIGLKRMYTTKCRVQYPRIFRVSLPHKPST